MSGRNSSPYLHLVSVLQYIVYNYNGAQRYERFLQVCQLYRALILLGLALLSSECLCIFGLHIVQWGWYKMRGGAGLQGGTGNMYKTRVCGTQSTDFPHYQRHAGPI